jgi:hypothetical protein
MISSFGGSGVCRLFSFWFRVGLALQPESENGGVLADTACNPGFVR